MFLFTLPIIAIPIALVFAAGALIRKRGDPVTASRRYFLFLTWTGIGLLAASLFISLPIAFPGLGYGLTLVLAPVTIGVIVVALLHLQEWHALHRRQKIIILSALLLLVIAHLWLGRTQEAWQRTEFIFLSLALVTISVCLFIVWRAGDRYPILFGMIGLLYLVVFNGLEMGSWPIPPESFPGGLATLGVLAFLAIPGFVIAILAMLIANTLNSLRGSGWVVWRLIIGRSTLVVILLGCFVYTFVWLWIWDGSDDGVRGFFMLTVSALAATSAGMVIGMTSSGWRAWSALIFTVLVIASIYRVGVGIGNRFSNYAMTEARAVRIQEAIENHRAKTGNYPVELEGLVPGELWRLPLPMIVPGQYWCYEAGSDYYRLGLVYREHWSSPYLNVRVYASAGNIPEKNWVCDEKLAEMMAQNDMLNTAPASTPLPTSVVSLQRTSVQPILEANALTVGSWSPEGEYLVFGPTRHTGEATEPVEIDIQFLNAQTGKLCGASENKWKAGERSDGLYEHYAWLPDGRFLYVSEAGEMVVFKPCADGREDLADRYPVKFTQAVTFDGTGGRALLKNQESYWLLDGTNMEVQQIPDVTPTSFEYQSDRYAWLPGGNRLAISQMNGQDASQGAIIYVIDEVSGKVDMSIPLVGPSEYVDAPIVDWLNKDELLVQFGDSLTIMDLHSDPPGITDLVPDVFLLDLSYPIDFSGMDFVRNPAGDGYYIGVQVNHPHNQDAYVYDSETEQVRVFQHDTSTLLFFPDGQCMRLLKWEDTPTYRDEYEMVWMDRPTEEHRLVLEGHVPRSNPQIFPRCLPGSSQLVFSSSQGVSLVSIPNGETIRFWELADSEGSSSAVFPSPLGEALVALADGDRLYFIPLPSK